eukprot:CAMPEP_0114560320 /NCGR_PEP_ID=MMETSP0114-20121206/11396_1 /TAXON_ID=31324 /ORGANISM="Goniomonas sp, Strain m" /LENGTH=220 /DNA_ID=CAMNT_0001745857 /DNA_START=8 /DNA_END=668 /DNA_ORIENTATION=-
MAKIALLLLGLVLSASAVPLTPERAKALAEGIFAQDAPSNVDVRDLIRKHEGSRPCVYVDTTGHHTIGVGFNLETSNARHDIESIGANFDEIYSGKKCLTEHQIDKLFTISLDAATSGARQAVSGYSGLCSNVQAVMVDMDFNLGTAGLESFGTFLSYINDHHWSQAAADMKAPSGASKWVTVAPMTQVLSVMGAKVLSTSQRFNCYVLQPELEMKLLGV